MPLATQRGGAEQLLRLLFRQVYESLLDIHVVFFDDGPLVDECRRLGIRCSVLHSGRLRHISEYIGMVRSVARLAEDLKSDVILSWMSKAHFYGSVAGWSKRIPSVWYQHGIPGKAAWLDRLITLLPAHGVLACSQAAAASQEQLWPARPTKVMYPRADLAAFNPEILPPPLQARSRLGLPLQGTLIGMVGRLQRWKGMHTLIDAMPKILKEHPETHAVIVGGCHALESEYEEQLDRQIQALDLEEHILRAGFQQDVPLWMQAMDVVVHASDNEPFGIVVIEAMALGKPVVAGDAGGPPEIIIEGVNGLLAPFEDSQMLARHVLRYINEPDFAERVGRRARQRALDFGPEQYAERLRGTMVELIGYDHQGYSMWPD